MPVAAIHIAKPQTIPAGTDEVVTGIFKYPISAQSIYVSDLGLEGDTIVDKTVHGGLDQAVYFYHAEDYAWWSEQLGRDIPYGSFGENITLSGVADRTWTIGDHLQLGELTIAVTAPRVPCFKLAARMGDKTFIKRFVQAERPGFYGRVLHRGTVAIGDALSVTPTDENYATIDEVFVAWHSPTQSPDLRAKALASPIACVHRSRIEQWPA